MYLKILVREICLFHVNKENWDQTHAVKFSKDTWHQIKIRERKGPSRGIIQKCEPHERSLCAPKFWERSHEETLHQERCAHRVAWDLAKHINKLKNADNATFCTPIEARVMSAPTSKSPEEREFVVDSGASMHMMSKKELSSDEMLCEDPGTPLWCLQPMGSAYKRGSTIIRSRS